MTALLINNSNVFELVELRDQITGNLITGLTLSGQVEDDTGAIVVGPFTFTEQAPGRFTATVSIGGLTIGEIYKIVISGTGIEIVEWVPARENSVE